MTPEPPLPPSTPAPPGRNLSIVSMVFGVFGLAMVPFVGSVVAIVTGLIAAKQLVGDKERRRVALIGIALGGSGLVVWTGLLIASWLRRQQMGAL